MQIINLYKKKKKKKASKHVCKRNVTQLAEIS